MAEVTTLKPKRSAKFPEGFAVGGLVQLKSGGAIMVITELLPGQPPVVHCEWHADFMSQEKSYPTKALRLAAQEDVDEPEDEA